MPAAVTYDRILSPSTDLKLRSVDVGAARLPAEYRSIVRGAESIRGRRVRAWGQSPQVHKNKLSQTPDVPESVVNRLTWGARSDAGTWNHAAKLKQLNGNCGRQSSNALSGALV